MITIDSSVIKVDDDDFEAWQGFEYLNIKKLPDAQYTELLHYFYLAQKNKSFEQDYFLFNQIKITRFEEFIYVSGEVSPRIELSISKGFYEVFYQTWLESKFNMPEEETPEGTDVQDFAKFVLQSSESLLKKYDSEVIKPCEIIYNDDESFVARLKESGPWVSYNGETLFHTALHVIPETKEEETETKEEIAEESPSE